ncbi:MAG: hypothetical protein KDI36_04150 [Pseudomonadales bacterium]|nr:hypothetical protein [Pseudomonadales bacterium]
MRPIVLQEDSLYIGLFRGEKDQQSGCIYSEVEGAGLKIGFVHAGVGYYQHRKIVVKEIPPDDGQLNHCKTPIAEVFIIGDNFDQVEFNIH